MFVGVVGAGQLGRMMALDGYRLGIRFRFYESKPGAPGAELAELIQGDYDDQDALGWFARGLDCITYEFENIPSESMDFLAKRHPVYPSPGALEVSQERLKEKNFLNELGVPTAPYAAIDSEADLPAAMAKSGTPAIIKSRRLGYDGKGQARVDDASTAAAAWDSIGNVPAISEGYVAFDRELSIVAVRNIAGEIAYYPLTENVHKAGILRLSIAPALAADEALQAQAEDYAKRILEKLDYVGVLAIEFFEKEGELIANELAPRVHNSGHWTIEGAETSQFENHLRAICGLPLGSTRTCGSSAMINLIGDLPALEKVHATPGAHLHLYNKSPRPGRKLGHVTLRENSREALLATLPQLLAVVCQGEVTLEDLDLR